MEVRLSFDKDGFEYEVFRARGAEYKIEILRDGEDITPGKGAIECDELLVDILGISYEVFTKTVIFSGNAQPFLELPLFQQRNIIEQLFNITMLSEKASVLKEEIRQVEQDIKIQEAICKQQEGAKELQQKHIREASARILKWNTDTAAEIKSIQDTLQIIGSIDFEYEKVLHTERSRLKEEGSYLGSKLIPLRKDKSVLERDVQKLLSEQKHLETAQCPYCSQPYADSVSKLESVLIGIEQKGSKLLELDALITETEAVYSTCKDDLSVVEGQIQYQNLDELLEARDNANALRQKIEALTSAINPHVEAHEKLLAEEQIKVDYQQVDALRKKVDHQQFLLKLLTDKNSFLRRTIINRSIPFLNARLNFFTQALGLPHIVKFDADMSCSVSEFGRELDFGNLSAGEKKRVNTAMVLAFRDVQHLSVKTNLLMIDELDGALDQIGIDAVMRILKEQSRDQDVSVYVISHHPSIAGRLDTNLIIRKEQGFSSVVFE
jgi:DNA repair exonuclease SbcCD ATPase subunit